MIVTSENSYVATIAVGLLEAFFVFLLQPDLTPHNWLTAAPIGLLVLAVSLYADVIRNSRHLEIDRELGIITENRRTLAFKWARREYPTSQFAAVNSYVTPFRSPHEHVELVTRTGGESLLISARRFRDTPKITFAPSAPIESQESNSLRLRLAEHLGIKDRGFLGYRWPGAYVSPVKREFMKQLKTSASSKNDG